MTMPRPSIKSASQPARANPKPPTGLPSPKSVTSTDSPVIAAAKSAVSEYEVQRRMLTEMSEEWEGNFPEANLARKDLLVQEDAVISSIKAAKPLVAAAGETVGDFLAQPKSQKAQYDEKEVTKLLGTFEDGPQIFMEMLDSGIIKVVSLERDAAIAWFAQHPAYAEAFQEAWIEEMSMTTSVTVPKL